MRPQERLGPGENLNSSSKAPQQSGFGQKSLGNNGQQYQNYDECSQAIYASSCPLSSPCFQFFFFFFEQKVLLLIESTEPIILGND